MMKGIKQNKKDGFRIEEVVLRINKKLE